ncbi:MAG: HD domain-containing phosphohydrolase [Planctomycetota bacterium]
MNENPAHGWMSAGWTRAVVVGAVLAAQAALLGGAWVLGLRHTVASVVDASQQSSAVATEGLAAGIAQAIARSGISDLERGGEHWTRVYDMLDAIRLPSGASVAVVAPDGTLLCRPGMSPLPGFDSTPARAAATTRSAAAAIPGLEALVVIDEPEHAAGALVARAPTAVILQTSAVALAVLILTAVAAAGLVSIHSRRLERQNRLLTERLTDRGAAVIRTRNAMIQGLAKLADYRDSDTGDHLDRICTMAVMLAQRLRDAYPEIDDAFIDNLRLAASLHDIGKVGVPDAVLLKPGRLTEDEMAVVRLHPGIGADTLEAIRDRIGPDDPLLNMSIRIARSHHERWDGAGYPDRLLAGDIPLEARIVAVADVYDALTSSRVYKAAMPHERAAEIIAQGAGSHFDPDVAGAFSELAGAFRDRLVRRRPLDAPALAAAA